MISLSVSSGSSNSLSSLSSSTKPQEPEFLILSGSSFSGMVGKTDYKSTRNVIVDYDVLFVRKQLHWLLLMRMVDSELSFVTIGITTTNLQDCVPTMRRLSTPTTSICTTHLNGDWSVPLLTCEPEAVGKYRGRLADICEVADSVWKTWRSTICLPITVSILLTTCSISWDSKHTRVGPQISVDMTNEEREFDLLSTVIKN